MTDAGICPGPCNSHYRKTRALYEKAVADHAAKIGALKPGDEVPEPPEPPEITPWPGEPVWCLKCAARIRHCLSELDDAGCLLAAEANGLRGGQGEQRVSGSQEHPSPSAAFDDLDELMSVLSGWEDAYRELRGWPSAARRGYLASRITATVAWLIAHLDGILESAFALDFGEETLQWHRELCGKAKAGARRLRKPMRCPGCRLLMLTWVEGEKYVQCGNRDCGRMLSLSEYESEVERIATTTQALAESAA